MYELASEKGITKNNMLRKVNKETYLQQPDRYELRRGNAPDAPLCPYGNHFEWIGYDICLLYTSPSPRD